MRVGGRYRHGGVACGRAGRHGRPEVALNPRMSGEESGQSQIDGTSTIMAAGTYTRRCRVTRRLKLADLRLTAVPGRGCTRVLVGSGA